VPPLRRAGTGPPHLLEDRTGLKLGRAGERLVENRRSWRCPEPDVGVRTPEPCPYHLNNKLGGGIVSTSVRAPPPAAQSLCTQPAPSPPPGRARWGWAFVGAALNPRANLAQLRRPLGHAHLVAASYQRQRGGKPPRPAPAIRMPAILFPPAFHQRQSGTYGNNPSRDSTAATRSSTGTIESSRSTGAG
jgi:hypothetical protein